MYSTKMNKVKLLQKYMKLKNDNTVATMYLQG